MIARNEKRYNAVKQIHIDLLTILSYLFLLVACTANRSTADNSTQSLALVTTTSQTASVEVTSTPILAPRSTLTFITTTASTPTLVLPTPPLPTWVMNDFFFSSKSPGCELPCWQNLTVGKSSIDEIQHLFNTVFGFNGDYSLLEKPIIRDVMGVYGKAHTWRFSDNPPESFITVVWVDENTNVLKGIQFWWTQWSDNTLDSNMSAQRIIRELGQPSYMLTTKSATEDGAVGIVKLFMIYDNGLAFYTSLRVPITRTTGKPIVEFCLGGERWNGAYNAATREAYIMEPITDGLDHLSPLQQHLIGINIEDYGVRPFEEVFGASLEKVTQLALQDGDACFHADMWDK